MAAGPPTPPDADELMKAAAKRRLPQSESIEVEPGSTSTSPTDPRDGRIPLWMLSDDPVVLEAADHLDFRAYANALTALITDPRTSTPLTIAINGPWGCGKSSLAHMIRRNLSESRPEGSDEPHITCWFNAWMHDDAPDIAAAFSSVVAQAADPHRGQLRRLFQPLPLGLLSGRARTQRRFFRGFILICAVLFVVLLTAEWRADPGVLDTEALVGLFGTVALAVLGGVRHFLEAAKSIRDFVGDPGAAAQRGTVHEVSAQLGELVREATVDGQRFVIFVDDVERCRPPRAVDLLEVINQLLSHERVVTVVMADLPAVSAAVELKYEGLVKHFGPGDGDGSQGALQAYGRRYLQKIIQLQFDIPGQRSRTIRDLFQKLSAESTPTVKEPPPWAGAEPSLRLRLSRDLQGAWRALKRWAKSVWAWNTRQLTTAWAPLVAVAPALLVIWRLGSVLSWNERLSLLFVAAMIGREVQVRLRARVLARESAAARLRLARAIEHGQRDPERLVELAAVPHLGREGRMALVREQLHRALVDPHSEIWIEAEREVWKHLPSLPRNAKRLVNRLRLLLSVAQERGLFEGGGVEVARRMGKWCVLGERWPEVAHEAGRSPDVLGRMEDAAAGDDEGFGMLAAAIVPAYADDEALRHLCASEPRLSPVIESIIYLDTEAAGREYARTP